MRPCDPALETTRPHPSYRRGTLACRPDAFRPAGRTAPGQGGGVRISVDDVRALYFDDGTPVTAASAVAPLGDGWLVAQDDSTSAAWWRAGSVTPVRLVPPVEGHDRFSEAARAKRLKPDLEVAFPAEGDGEPAVLLLGSGSTDRRPRGALLRLVDGHPVVQAGGLAPLHAAVVQCLGLAADQLNLEGAARRGDTV